MFEHFAFLLCRSLERELALVQGDIIMVSKNNMPTDNRQSRDRVKRV